MMLTGLLDPAMISWVARDREDISKDKNMLLSENFIFSNGLYLKNYIAIVTNYRIV